jgi:hypothetical protein
MQLRFLQTLTEVAGEKSSTIVFPVPTSVFDLLQRLSTSRSPTAG